MPNLYIKIAPPELWKVSLQPMVELSQESQGPKFCVTASMWINLVTMSSTFFCLGVRLPPVKLASSPLGLTEL